MISEDMLRQAAAQFSDAMLVSVEDRPHDFSARFERRMQPLLRRAEHPVRYRLVRQCAAVFLALLIAFGSLLALSPSVRAIVSGWFRTIIHDDIYYLPSEGTQPPVQYDYYLPEILDGYTLLDIAEYVDERTYIYVNESGQLMQFGYMRGGQGASLVIFDPLDYAYHTGMVGEDPAEIYIAPDPVESSAIVWNDTENDVLLYIFAHADMDELIALAEKVEKKIIISDWCVQNHLLISLLLVRPK